MDVENKYSSKGWAALNTVLGSIGTAGATGILNNLGGILGGGAKTTCDKGNGGDAAALAYYFSAMNNLINNAEHRCGDGYVTSKEAALTREIADRDSRISHLESTIYTDQKIADVYERLNTKIGVIEAQINAQAVINAQVAANISCMQTSIGTLLSLTKTIIPIDNICPAPAVATSTAG